MPRTKKEKEPSQKVYEKLGPFTIMKKPFISNEGSDFYIDVTTEQGDNTQHACTKDLYKEIVTDRLYSNYRVAFYLHRAGDSLVTNISTEPKRQYSSESYQVEYEDEMVVPDKSVYKDPAD